MNTQALLSLKDAAPLYPPDSNSTEAKAIQKFCDDNNFALSLRKSELVAYAVRDYKTLPAWLGLVGFGARKDAYFVAEGNHKGYPIVMFEMWDALANGVIYKNPTEQEKRKYTQQQSTGIVKITLPKVFPQIVLDSNKNDRFQSSLRTEYKASQKVQLEGDFAQYFDLFIPQGLHVDALSLLAPNMMEIIMEHSGLFDVEFNGNEMILMTREFLYAPQAMSLLDSALTEQLAYMDHMLKSWNYVPKRKPHDILVKKFITGSPLKIGSYRIGARTQLLLIGLAFVVAAVFIAIN